MKRFDITVAGELNLDLILNRVPEVLPPDQERIVDRIDLTLGSSSAIVAHNLAALGCRVGFGSCVGDDTFGDIALKRLFDAGVDVSTVSRMKDGTGTGVSIILVRKEWRNILTFLGSIPRLRADDLNVNYLSSSRHFHISSYFLQRELQPGLPGLLRALKSAGLTISLDTNDDPEGEWKAGLDNILPLVDIFLPNEREAIGIAQCPDIHESLRRLAAVVPLVVIKRAEKGALASNQGRVIESPAVSAELVDAVGAGDSFNAGFLHEYIQGSPLEACLWGGNQAAGLSITAPGGTEAFRKPENIHRVFGERSCERLALDEAES